MADETAPTPKKPRMNDQLIPMMKANMAKNGLAGAKGAFLGTPYLAGGSPSKGGHFVDPHEVYGAQWAAKQAMQPTPKKPQKEDPALPPSQPAAPAAAPGLAEGSPAGSLADAVSPKKKSFNGFAPAQSTVRTNMGGNIGGRSGGGVFGGFNF